MGHLHGSFLGLRRNNVRKNKKPAEIGAKLYEIYVKLSQEHPKLIQKAPKGYQHGAKKIQIMPKLSQ